MKFIGIQERRGNKVAVINIEADDIIKAGKLAREQFGVDPRMAASVKVMSPAQYDDYRIQRMRGLKAAEYQMTSFERDLEATLSDKRLVTLGSSPFKSGRSAQKPAFGRARSPEDAPELKEFVMVRCVIGEEREIDTIKAASLEQAIRVGRQYMANPFGRVDDYSYVVTAEQHDLQERMRQSPLAAMGSMKDLSENQLHAARGEVMRCEDEKDLLNALAIEPDAPEAPFVVIVWQKAMGISGRSHWQLESMLAGEDKIEGILTKLGLGEQSDLGITLKVVHEGVQQRLTFENAAMTRETYRAPSMTM